jgi:hypothetical protein
MAGILDYLGRRFERKVERFARMDAAFSSNARGARWLRWRLRWYWFWKIVGVIIGTFISGVVVLLTGLKFLGWGKPLSLYEFFTGWGWSLMLGALLLVIQLVSWIRSLFSRSEN